MSKTRAPEITSLDPDQLQKLLVQLQQHLPAALYENVATLLGTLQWLMGVIEKKNATVGRLQRLIFGAKTEKTRNVFPGKGVPASAVARKRRVRGHGRNGASQYAGAGRVQVPHPSLRPGDCCPECRSDKARLRERPPSRIVRILAQPMVQATIFALQVLRCCLCGKTFAAPAPPEAGTSKYDPNVGLMIGILRFGGGMPHYRLEKLQKDLGIPLPAATQWELMEQSARDLQPAHQELIRLAAQAQLFHNDDTKMRIQSLKQERAQAGCERTGIFTTSIICQVEDRSIALYFTGGNHAGENLTELLQHRATGLDKPIHMCDGLARNLPKDFEALLANCLPHGRRAFVDVKEYFPQQCQKVLEDLALVFQRDAQAKEQRLSATDRLRLHQEKSAPIMEGLKQWMEEQLEQKVVEPNSSLGEAINYMLKRWEPLTLFLREPGAPLSNNICERALKAAILHRKNSLGYKTQNGARVGDLFMSLIHTCRLAAANPFAYFRALHDHAKAVLKDPGAWLPWNYSQSIEALDSG
jgi:transposase